MLYADHIEGRGVDFFRTVCEQNLEGIVAKRMGSVYSSAGYWLKIKNPLYAQAEGRRELFESMRPAGPKKVKLPAVSVEKTGA